MPQNTRRYFEESEQLLEGRKPESPEFAALMRAKIGDRFRNLVTPEKLGLMALIGDPKTRNWNVAGINFPTGLDTPENVEAMREEIAPVLDETGQELPKGKRIFGVGSQADAATYAHELRHEAVENETTNRMLDLVHGSTSLPAYKANIDKAYMWLTDFDYRRANAPYQEKEKFVLDNLRSFIKREAYDSGMTAMNGHKYVFDNDFVNKNIELNKSGAVGAFDASNKQLDKNFIVARAKLPFLNFVGRIEEPTPKKKASGGMIENTTHDRKTI